MSKIIIVCKSITHAQQMLNAVTRAGFWAGIDRTPSAIRTKNCSYSVTIYARDLQYIKPIISRFGDNLMFLYEDKKYKNIGGVRS